MRILSIDPGLTRTGFSVIDDFKILKIGTVTTAKNKSTPTNGARIHKIKMFVISLINEFNPDMICIEEFFFSKKGANGASTAKVIGALIAEFAAFKKPYRLYSPQEIKRSFGGTEATARKRKGETDNQKRERQKNAVRDGVIQFMQLQYNPFKADHESDAVAIACAYLKGCQCVDG